MNNKLLLVKSVTLIYLQSKTGNHTISIKPLIQDIINRTRPADKALSNEYGESTIQQLRDTVIWMNSNDVGHEYNNSDLKQRFKIIAGDDDGLYNGLCSMLVDNATDEQSHQLLSEFKLLNSEINKEKICQILKEVYSKISYQPETVEWETLLVDINNRLKPYEIKGNNDASNHPAKVGEIDFSKIDTINNAMSSAKNELSREGVIRTPFQGVNRMLGKHGGFRRGESVLVGALKHQNKSGFMYDIFVGTALFNFPYLKDPTKKPLNLRISFENKTEADVKGIYQRIYAFDTGKVIDPQNINVEEASGYVAERLSVNGWYNKTYHFTPSDYSYFDLFALFDQLEAEGYEIVICTIDYLNMMSKKGCNKGATGADVQDLYRRVKNECLRRSITFVTPHQLSSDAMRLLRTGQSNFVREVSDKSYWHECVSLGQEPDLEIIVHIEKVNGESYFTMHRGKHRDVYTAIENHYVVYKFSDYGLPYDINGLDQSRRSVGGDLNVDGGSDPWFNVEG